MGARQLKLRQIMVEFGGCPACRRMTLGTVGREVAGLVTWVGGAFKVLHMAAVTSRSQTGVAPRDVALAADKRRMSSGERKFRGRVIKLCVAPGAHVVATEAIMAEAGLNVARNSRVRKILRVTAEAVRGSADVPVAGVALGALKRLVGTGQREGPELAMVEPGARPGIDAVTVVARRGEIGCLMVRLGGGSILLHMA